MQMKNWMKYTTMGLLTAGMTIFAANTASAQTLASVTANKVNVRDASSMSSNVLYMVNNGEPLEILGAEDKFYQINIKNDANVYIAKEYVKITQADGMVLVNDTLFCLTPSEDDLINYLPEGELLSVTASCGDWYVVVYGGITGYVQKSAVSVPDYLKLSEKKSPNSNSNGDKADDIIAYARQFIGTRYSYGSMSPSKGFDCSGFVSYVMKNFDVSLNRSSRAMASDGFTVSRNELQAGDLVFFATGGGSAISHVGMYIGNGEFIHSSTSRGVIIDRLSQNYYNSRFVKATRVL